MKSRLIAALAAAAAIALAPAAALAQRQAPPTPEQRIDRLERQVQQVQRQVFPKGRPADTAGFSDDPAATQSSVVTLDQRLDALERQMADLVRQSEENGNGCGRSKPGWRKLKSDQDQRISALEQRMSEAATAAAARPRGGTHRRADAAAKPSRRQAQADDAAKTDWRRPPPASAIRRRDAAPATPARTPTAGLPPMGGRPVRPGDRDAEGLHRGLSQAPPVELRQQPHRPRAARQGRARDAAAALLANYRSNPAGERAPDSLYYLGQALMKLGQPGQACKAYAELDAVYGAKVRPDLKKQEADAKAQAQCS